MSYNLSLANKTHPYFEQSSDKTELEEYEEYCRQELPLVVQVTVEEIVNRETQPIEERLIGQLESITRSAQDRLFTNYRSACNAHTAKWSSYEVTSTSTAEAAPMQRNTAVNFQNEQSYSSMRMWSPSEFQLDLSRRENNVSTGSERRSALDSGYGSSSLPPQTSNEQLEFERFSCQSGSSGRVQSSGPNFPSKSLQDSRNDRDRIEVNEPSDHDSTFDLNHSVSVGFEEEELNDFDFDTFLSQP